MEELSLPPGTSEGPSYHDLYVTTPEIPRTRLFDLPYGLQVTCSRVTGWQLWETALNIPDWRVLAGEYDVTGKWLVLDVNGIVIVDSRRNYADGDPTIVLDGDA